MLLGLPTLVTVDAQRLLGWLHRQDGDVAAHCTRVASHALAIGRELGLDAHALEELELGARLHDVGKGLLPHALIHKPGAPQAWERLRLRSHAPLGATLLRTAGLSTTIQAVAAAHHEWWDGGGYPARLRGAEIPLLAQITAVADAYDAMTARRSYRETWTPKTAADEIRSASGSQFSPEVVRAFHAVTDLSQPA